ncbi:MAG: serine protease [Polyangiaceae bacterium]
MRPALLRLVLATTFVVSVPSVAFAAEPDTAKPQAPPSSASICEFGWEAKVAASALPSVVRVENEAGPVLQMGAGFVAFDDKHVVTAFHVVRDLDAAMVVRFRSGETRRARLFAHDRKKDVAILELTEAAPAPPIPFAKRDPVIGEGVLSLGHPLGIYADRPEDFDDDVDNRGMLNWSVSRGVVSAWNGDAVQADAPSVTHGSSGGPLLACDGTVLAFASGTISQEAAAAHLMIFVRGTHAESLRTKPDTAGLPRNRKAALSSVVSVPVQFRNGETFVGGMLSVGAGTHQDVLRARASIALLGSSDEPASPNELLVGNRQRFYWSVDASYAPRVLGERSSIRPAFVVGLSSMTDSVKVRSFHAVSGGACADGTDACGRIERSDTESTIRAYRPFVGAELRLGPVEIGYTFHADVRSVSRSVHGLQFGVNFGSFMDR